VRAVSPLIMAALVSSWRPFCQSERQAPFKTNITMAEKITLIGYAICTIRIDPFEICSYLKTAM